MWLGGVAAGHMLSRRTGREVTLCPMRWLAGIPCPTCGLTRAGFLLLRGRPMAAIAQNPLFVTAGLVLLGMLAIRLVAGRTFEVKLAPGQRTAALLLAAAAVGVNWAYVIVCVG
ncbi:MAG: DUF2752 domain-containing protein [Phycisphaerae bacterium]